MGFKVIETEEELRSAHSAGLLWFKYNGVEGGVEAFSPEFVVNTSELAHEWRIRQGSWESYILVEDE